MSEMPLPPGIIPPPKEEPVPFFKTIDFTKRPKWEVSQSFVTELEHMLIGVQEGDNKNAYLANKMKEQYGKNDAMEILEHISKHMDESIRRSSYKDTQKLHEFVERAQIARGIIGTPNWKDPDKQPPPIRFSAK